MVFVDAEMIQQLTLHDSIFVHLVMVNTMTNVRLAQPDEDEDHQRLQEIDSPVCSHVGGQAMTED